MENDWSNVQKVLGFKKYFPLNFKFYSDGLGINH